MGFTYDWKITGLKKQNTNDLSDVIVGTYWTVEGTDETDGLKGSFVGATPFKVSELDPNTFTTYENLTEEQVLGWIKNVVSGSNTVVNYWAHIQEQIVKSIERQRYNVSNVMASKLPWAPSGSNEIGPI